MKQKLVKASAAALTAFILVGCQTNTNLYQWGSYQPQVYKHLNGDSPNQQIADMEKDLQTLGGAGKKPPPGFHAHLGMLYSMVGRNELMAAQFQEEKRLFPESAPYMNRLLGTMSKGRN